MEVPEEDDMVKVVKMEDESICQPSTASYVVDQQDDATT
jgi:hypothetical protein